MVNVPTVMWIDEEGRIARPNDGAVTTDKGGRYARVSTEEQMELLRTWVRDDRLPPTEELLKSQVAPMTSDSQIAHAN